jgi:phage-related minor tail protein
LLVTDAGLSGKAQKVSGDIENAYAKSKLAVEGFSEAQIKAYNAWATEVEALEEAAKKVEDYEKAVTEANLAISESFAKDLEESLASGKLNFQSFADTVIAEITRLQVIKPLMESLFGQDGSGKGGLFGGSEGGIVQTIGSFLGFAKGGAFNYNGLQEYANGGAFHNSVLHKPTPFIANGRMAVAGEAGSEAVMPLTRIGGELGVKATGMGNVTVQPQIKINIVNNAGAKVETQQQTDGDGNINMTVMINQIEGAISDRARRGQGLANVFKRVG